MRKMRKVIVTLAIMAFVFGGSQALAGSVSCSLNGQKKNESTALDHNYMSKYRCSASTQKRSAKCIVVQVWGGSNKSCPVLYGSMAVPNNVTAKTIT